MHLRRHSRNSIPSRNSEPLRSWVNSWKPDSHNRSSLRGGGLGADRFFFTSDRED